MSIQNKQEIIGNLSEIELPIINIVNEKKIETREFRTHYETLVFFVSGLWITDIPSLSFEKALDVHFGQVAIAERKPEIHACEYCGTDKMPTFYSRIRQRWLCSKCHNVHVGGND